MLTILPGPAALLEAKAAERRTLAMAGYGD
jgi:hypothetical protein